MWPSEGHFTLMWPPVKMSLAPWFRVCSSEVGGFVTHLDDLIDEAHVGDRVSLLGQNLLQMLHLPTDNRTSVLPLIRAPTQVTCTCLHAAHIWSISFSKFVHRAALKAAVFPGAGSAARPGAPEGGHFGLVSVYGHGPHGSRSNEEPPSLK